MLLSFKNSISELVTIMGIFILLDTELLFKEIANLFYQHLRAHSLNPGILTQRPVRTREKLSEKNTSSVVLFFLKITDNVSVFVYLFIYF